MLECLSHARHSPNLLGWMEVGSCGIRVRTANPQEECSLLVSTSREVTSWDRDEFCAGGVHTEPEEASRERYEFCPPRVQGLTEGVLKQE